MGKLLVRGSLAGRFYYHGWELGGFCLWVVDREESGGRRKVSFSSTPSSQQWRRLLAEGETTTFYDDPRSFIEESV